LTACQHCQSEFEPKRTTAGSVRPRRKSAMTARSSATKAPMLSLAEAAKQNGRAK
jgi:hypothetical protein